MLPLARRVRAALLMVLSVLAGSAAATEWQPLAPGVELLRGAFVPGQQPDGNSLLIVDDGQRLLFDSGRHGEHGARLLARLQQGGNGPLLLVNSHWHLDHSGNLPMLRDAYPAAALYASEAIIAARSGFLPRYQRQLEQLQAQPIEGGPDPQFIAAELARIAASAAMLPDHAVRGPMPLALGKRRLQLGLGRGVSGGDVWLYDPASGVLAAGDLLTLPAPLFDTACPRQWQADLKQLAQQPFQQLLPGHGRVLQRAEFERWQAAFDALLDCADSDTAAAECRDHWLEQIDPLIEASERTQGGMLLDYYLGQVLRNRSVIERACATSATSANDLSAG